MLRVLAHGEEQDDEDKDEAKLRQAIEQEVLRVDDEKDGAEARIHKVEREGVLLGNVEELLEESVHKLAA
eukprot:CAMPEP_0185598388 /NCGR_PEP_ID=MMETSP0434-20130131/81958_1 /TAXON_ID=626734 ORGANISM="Favella taraikaensis, Strain Fe Narragansett Bay" /NCGR_SAMPLE_ID=MMETSP0434 /ASSEMBLY_ACC=CAM_ASM_000379 /LENGTH=69 /DNA_ID=CAMNT_0028227343 /DNA_START=1117 /DNA_END=1326 /DNA_ORIENTATION=+